MHDLASIEKTAKQHPALVLAAILAVQLVLAVGLSVGGPGKGASAKEPLLIFDAAAVDGIAIDETGANSVTLARRDGTWMLPELLSFPADSQKVDGLLAKLAQLKKGWPVAASSEAAERFKVTDASHERRIVLKKGDKVLGELLLGTSPSFRLVHARVRGDSNVYNVAFANYDAGSRNEDWLKRDIIAIPDDKIASIGIGDVTLERKDGKYAVTGLASDEKQKDSEVWRLAGAVARPAFDAVQGKGPDALAKVNEPDIKITVKRTDGPEILSRYKKEADGAYLFASSMSDYLFRVGEASIQPIVKAKREALVEQPKKPEEKKPEETKKPEGEATQAVPALKTPEASSGG